MHRAAIHHYGHDKKYGRYYDPCTSVFEAVSFRITFRVLFSGVEGEPYLTNYLKVLGNSFIGIDLVGEFEDFRKLKEVQIELGKNLFTLSPVHPAAFESLAIKINQINVDSPDIREDYQVLGINMLGKKELVDQVY